MSQHSRRPRIRRIVRRVRFPLLALFCLILSQVSTIGPGAAPAIAHAASPPLIDSVLITGSSSNPTVTVNGGGFGSTAPTPTVTSPANYTGADYGPGALSLHDSTNAWDAGLADTPSNGTHYDYIALQGVAATYQDTGVRFTFGSAYGAYGSLNQGDRFTVTVAGATCSGTVTFGVPVNCAPVITSVTFGGSASSPSITVDGYNFGPTAPTPTVTNPAGYTGADYGAGVLSFHDSTNGWDGGLADTPSGGSHYDYIALQSVTYQDTRARFTFGSAYGAYGSLNQGDRFSLTIGGVTCAGTVNYSATPVSCARPTITSVDIGGSQSAPTLTVHGSGFGGQAPPSTAIGNFSGNDFGNNLGVSDLTGNWNGGQYGNGIGLSAGSYGDSQISLTFGSYYGATSGFYLQPGDAVTIFAEGAACMGIVKYPTTLSCSYVSGVTFTGSASNPTVTINGTGFGAAPSPSGAQPNSNTTYCASCTGSNYGSQLYIADTNPRNPGGSWTAGSDGNFVGLVLQPNQYPDTQVQYSFGSYYGQSSISLQAGDQFTVRIAGQDCTGTVAYGAPVNVSCTQKAPSVTGLSPSTGPIAGGAQVTISGAGFSGATGVTFGGKAAAFSVAGDSSIVATSPQVASGGPVDVQVTAPNGTSAAVAVDQYVYYAPPTVTKVSPSSGSPAGGTRVTISGAGLLGATSVTFGGVPATNVSFNSDGSIVATSPVASKIGPVDVQVTTPGGASATGSADIFTYVPSLYVAPGGNDANTCRSLDNPCATLNGALSQAGAGDTIGVVTGTYQTNATINGSVTIVGAGAGKTILDGAQSGPVVTVGSGGNTTIAGLTIQNGAGGIGSSLAGGAENYGRLTLANTLVMSNTGPYGGIDNNGSGGGSLLLYNDVVAGNTATAAGGGLHSSNPVAVVASTFSGNSAGTNGGGIYSSGTMTVANTIVASNTATLGGGIAQVGGSLSSQGNIIDNNTSGRDGGGVYLSNAAGSVMTTTVAGNAAPSATGGGVATDAGSTLALSASTLNGNLAASGGAIANGGTTTLTNATISGNAAFVTTTGSSAPTGGGILNSGALSLVNSTVVSNTAVVSGTSGGGAGGGLSGSATLLNTILAGNTAATGPDCNGALTSSGHNLVGVTDGSVCTGVMSGTTGDLTGIDPQLTPLTFNGGAVRVQAPVVGSPAIDAGANSGCPVTDARGIARPSGGACDIGAVEVSNELREDSLQLSNGAPVTGASHYYGNWNWYKIPVSDVNSTLSIQVSSPSAYDVAVFAPQTNSSGTENIGGREGGDNTHNLGKLLHIGGGFGSSIGGGFGSSIGGGFGSSIGGGFNSGVNQSTVVTAATTASSGNANIVVNVRDRHGPWYIAVPGDNPAVAGTFALTATVTPPTAPASPFITASVPMSTSFATTAPPCTPDKQTLILYNSARLAAGYPADPNTPVLASTLQALAADSTVNGCLVDLSRYPAIWNTDPSSPGAYQQWDANSGDPYAANYVAASIKSLISWATSSWPAPTAASPRYLVLAGDDDQIPFYRQVDETVLANEAEYTFPHHAHTPQKLAAALGAESFLTDGYYGVRQPLLADGRAIYTPSQPGTALSTGRLVESPSDIVSYINMYLGLSGRTIRPTSSFVNGYDFLTSEARDISGALATAALTPTTLINDAWSASDLTGTLFASSTPYGLVSLNSHFDDNTLYANAPLTSPLARATLSSTIITGTTPFSGSLVYSVGCHSGFDAPDDGVLADRSWPRAFMQTGATYIGNTGYGYAASDLLGYSAQLMSFFTRNLSGPSSGTPTVGAALDQAKEQYLTAMLPGTFNIIDKKVLQEATLYGLPMAQVALPNRPAGPTAPSAIPAVGTINTTVSTPVSASFTLGQNTIGTRGAYESIQGQSITAAQGAAVTGQADIFAGDNRPVQPRSVFSAASPGATAHGVLVTGGTFTDTPGFQPVVESAVTDQVYLAQQAEPIYGGNQLYPEMPASLNLPGQGVVMTPAQFVTTAAATQTVGTERAYSGLNVQVYSAPAASTDFNAPVFGTQQPSIDPRAHTITFAWQVSDDSLIVRRVLVLYARLNGGATTWSSADLSYDPASGLFVGAAPLPDGAGPIEYMAQAVDGSGNVAHTGDFQVTDAGLPLAQPPLIVPTINGPAGANGWYTGPVSLGWTVAGGAAPLVATDGCGTQSVTGETGGVAATCAATSTGGVISNTATIRVDGTPPTTAIASAPNSFTNADATVTFAPTDNLSGVAATYYSLDGAAPRSVVNSTVTIAAEGVHALTYWSVDIAGNVESPHTRQVKVDKTAPIVLGTVTTQSSGVDSRDPANPVTWYNGDVAVQWTCTDLPLADGAPGSGCAAMPASSTITGEGRGITATVPAADVAGNIATGVSPAVNIDRTPPNTAISAPSTWQDTAVSVVLTPTDSLSGVKATYYQIDGGAVQTSANAIRTTVPIASDGRHTLTYRSVDYAGNSEIAQTATILVDQHGLSIVHAVAPIPNNDNWNNTAVTVSFTCTDSLSGVTGCATQRPVSSGCSSGAYACTVAQGVATQGKGQVITATATDGAGGAANDSVPVNIDELPPLITPTVGISPSGTGPGALSWYNSAPTVRWSCLDQAIPGAPNGSGILGSCPADTVFGEGFGQGASRAVTDTAGNGAVGTVSGLNVDEAPPALTVTAPASATAYTLNQSVPASYACADPSLVDGHAGSGVAACVGTSAAGAAIDTRSVGAKTFSVSSKDYAGNTSARTLTYIVSYAINPLYDTTQSKKSGSTFPLSLQLRDAKGANLSSSSIPVKALYVTDASGKQYPVQWPGNSQPGGYFTYGAGGYQFNLKTTGLPSGAYTLAFTAANDPATHTTPFAVS